MFFDDGCRAVLLVEQCSMDQLPWKNGSADRCPGWGVLPSRSTLPPWTAVSPPAHRDVVPSTPLRGPTPLPLGPRSHPATQYSRDRRRADRQVGCGSVLLSMDRFQQRGCCHVRSVLTRTSPTSSMAV